MSLARDITTVGGGTLMSRLLAYLRDAWIAALLGAEAYSEAFFAVLQVVNFFRRLLSEGALNGAFVPIWLKLRGGEDGVANACRFTLRAMVMIGIFTGIVVLIVTIFAPSVIAVIAPGFEAALRNQATLLLMIVAPYIVLAGLVAVGAAVLSAQGRVFIVAVSTAIFNLVLLLALTLIARETDRMWITIWLAMAIVIAGFGQLLIVTAALQLKLIAATAIASASPAAVAWLYYANRLYELPLGVASAAMAAVIVPRISASVHAGDAGADAAAQSRAYEIALGLALPSAVGFALLANPIAGGLFERGAFGSQDTDAVAAALAAICAGLPGHVLEKAFGAVSFAHEDTHTPMYTALCGLAAAIAGGVLLFPLYGPTGVAAAIAISGWVGASLLGAVLYWRRWLRLDNDARRRLPRIGLATIVMAAVIACVGYAVGAPATSLGRLELLAVLVTLGVAVYGTALHVLGVAKFKDVAAALHPRA